MWDKLSNSGDILKLLVPEFRLMNLSGRSDWRRRVTSQKMTEKEIDNRGSKSGLNDVNSSSIALVKEQRVYGSWYDLYLRFTLMDLKRNYLVKILSNQMNNIRTYASTTSHITLDPYMNPWFITGFTGSWRLFLHFNSKKKMRTIKRIGELKLSSP